jgi:hypothetical protein
MLTDGGPTTVTSRHCTARKFGRLIHAFLRTTTMSTTFLSLPQELLSNVAFHVRFDPLGEANPWNLILVNRRLYDATLRALYFSPINDSPQSAQHLHELLLSRPDLARFVKSYNLELKHFAEHPTLGPYPPELDLPHCERLKINIYHATGTDEGLSMVDVLRCATKCPSLRAMTVRNLSIWSRLAGTANAGWPVSAPTEAELAALGITVPKTLKTVHLIQFLGSASEALWSGLCTGLRHLYLQYVMLRRAEDYAGIRFAAPTLRYLSIYHVGAMVGWENSKLLFTSKSLLPAIRSCGNLSGGGLKRLMGMVR